MKKTSSVASPLSPADALTELTRRSREVALFSSISSILQWDQQTYQPRLAGEYRAEQLAALSAHGHALWTAPEVGEWLTRAEEAAETPSPETAANLREWRRSYDRATKLPAKLVEELALTAALAHEAWVEARAAADFDRFAPHLAKLVELTREQARCWGGADAYDALLEGYEVGATRRELQALFERLAPEVASLARQGEERPPSAPWPRGPYPVAAQQAFNREVAEALGYDFAAGRIDTAAHPFCTTLGPQDVRLTTRYDETDFTSSLLGVLHEAGHGLYEQGLPGAAFGTPVGQAISLGIHESQSRLWENHVGRSRSFWEHWFPRACAFFPELKTSSPEAVYGHVNRVRRSFIRVEADAVTYDLHIILRFRLETALIDGDLAVRDLPAAWNEEFRRLFDLEVPDAARGCLQDVHWSGGAFGYFPTYTLGNLNAAQLFQAAHRDLCDLEGDLAVGNYRGLRTWLREKIHAPGSTFLPGELMERATGAPTQPEAHLAYLSELVGH